MNLSQNLKSKCGLSPSRKTLRTEIDKLLDQYTSLTKRYSALMRFNVSCMYGFTEILQSNDINHIKKVIQELSAELPPADG